VLRVAGEGGNMRPREYRAYCAVALAGLGHLPQTIATRAITIPMRRRAPDGLVRPYRERITRPEGEQLRRRLAAWVQRHGDGIPEAPELPGGVTDRPADCWEPLVAIGDAAPAVAGRRPPGRRARPSSRQPATTSRPAFVYSPTSAPPSAPTAASVPSGCSTASRR
jgi:hypothetical protein